jgi:hypothetical protein
MIAKWIPDLVKTLTLEEAASALRLALNLQLKSDPSVEVLALAVAKTALETGRWKAIHRFNFGNVKAGESYTGLYTTFRCNEIIKGKVQWFDPTTDGFADPPGHPQTRFRAYQSAAEGAAAYVSFVAGGRYAAAWQRLLAGDAAGYVHALKVAGYFTADEGPYVKGVVSLQREFIGKLKALPDHEVPIADVDHAAIAAGINAEDRTRIETMRQLWFDSQLHPEDPEPTT